MSGATQEIEAMGLMLRFVEASENPFEQMSDAEVRDACAKLEVLGEGMIAAGEEFIAERARTPLLEAQLASAKELLGEAMQEKADAERRHAEVMQREVELNGRLNDLKDRLAAGNVSGEELTAEIDCLWQGVQEDATALGININTMQLRNG